MVQIEIKTMIVAEISWAPQENKLFQLDTRQESPTIIV
jgi:hypothetical protein